MAINFKLSDRREIKAATDPMGRSWVGWDPSASPEVNFEQNRGRWLIGRRGDSERFATFSVDGRIVLVAETSGIEDSPDLRPDHADKRAIVGRLLTPADAAYASFIGREVDSHRNPVTYIADDPGEHIRRCACGCGEPTAGRAHFLPGHDQKAIHERIARQWGDTVGFITWFDATYRRDAA
jgi:hypothetical protein